jgi:ADP-heptose:LPS heptosyltransferase
MQLPIHFSSTLNLGAGKNRFLESFLSIAYKMSRLPLRLLSLSLAVVKQPLRRKPAPGRDVKKILIAHYLLLGDTLLLAPLLAKLALQYPDADVLVMARPSIASLFAKNPYGCRVQAYEPRSFQDFCSLLAQGPFDLAYVLGDNRYAWLARAVGARWIVGFGQDKPGWKNWMLDVSHVFPSHPGAWADIAAGLVPGPPPAPYRSGDWPLPDAVVPRVPQTPYAVLHVGASTPLKSWSPSRWRELAARLQAVGITPVWSAGRGEERLLMAIAPPPDQLCYCGNLTLPQLALLIQKGRVLICPDTGVAHLGKIVGAPTVVLFGPGTAAIYGAGEFWREAKYCAVSIDDFPCRNQSLLFRRKISWVRRCGRNVEDCTRTSVGLIADEGIAPCMHALNLKLVLAACLQFVPNL